MFEINLELISDSDIEIVKSVANRMLDDDEAREKWISESSNADESIFMMELINWSFNETFKSGKPFVFQIVNGKRTVATSYDLFKFSRYDIIDYIDEQCSITSSTCFICIENLNDAGDEVIEFMYSLADEDEEDSLDKFFKAPSTGEFFEENDLKYCMKIVERIDRLESKISEAQIIKPGTLLNNIVEIDEEGRINIRDEFVDECKRHNIHV